MKLTKEQKLSILHELKMSVLASNPMITGIPINTYKEPKRRLRFQVEIIEEEKCETNGPAS